jgi:hypothetical protein
MPLRSSRKLQPVAGPSSWDIAARAAVKWFCTGRVEFGAERPLLACCPKRVRAARLNHKSYSRNSHLFSTRSPLRTTSLTAQEIKNGEGCKNG